MGDIGKAEKMYQAIIGQTEKNEGDGSFFKDEYSREYFLRNHVTDAKLDDAIKWLETDGKTVGLSQEMLAKFRAIKGNLSSIQNASTRSRVELKDSFNGNIDITYDSNFADISRWDSYPKKPTRGFIQEGRNANNIEVKVLWNADKTTIHSIVIKGTQYVNENGVFKSDDEKVITVNHYDVSKQIQVRQESAIVSKPTGAPGTASDPIVSPPRPSPAPAGSLPNSDPAIVSEPTPPEALPEKERLFQAAMKNYSFTLDGKPLSVNGTIFVGPKGKDAPNVTLVNGNTTLYIPFILTSGTYTVDQVALKEYTATESTLPNGKKIIALMRKSPDTPAPAAAPTAPVAPVVPAPTAPAASPAASPAAPVAPAAKKLRTANDVIAGNKEFIEGKRTLIDPILDKITDAPFKDKMKKYLTDGDNQSIRAFQISIGAKPSEDFRPDGDFRDKTLAALTEWDGKDKTPKSHAGAPVAPAPAAGANRPEVVQKPQGNEIDSAAKNNFKSFTPGADDTETSISFKTTVIPINLGELGNPTTEFNASEISIYKEGDKFYRITLINGGKNIKIEKWEEGRRTIVGPHPEIVKKAVATQAGSDNIKLTLPQPMVLSKDGKAPTSGETLKGEQLIEGIVYMIGGNGDIYKINALNPEYIYVERVLLDQEIFSKKGFKFTGKLGKDNRPEQGEYEDENKVLILLSDKKLSLNVREVKERNIDLRISLSEGGDFGILKIKYPQGVTVKYNKEELIKIINRDIVFKEVNLAGKLWIIKLYNVGRGIEVDAEEIKPKEDPTKLISSISTYLGNGFKNYETKESGKMAVWTGSAYIVRVNGSGVVQFLELDGKRVITTLDQDQQAKQREIMKLTHEAGYGTPAPAVAAPASSAASAPVPVPAPVPASGAASAPQAPAPGAEGTSPSPRDTALAAVGLTKKAENTYKEGEKTFTINSETCTITGDQVISGARILVDTKILQVLKSQGIKKIVATQGGQRSVLTL